MSTFHKYKVTYISLNNKEKKEHLFSLSGYRGDKDEFMEYYNDILGSHIQILDVEYLGEIAAEFKK